MCRRIVFTQGYREETRTNKAMEKNARIIALYLPQYHPIRENEEWWGKGFTEWTSVGRAKSLFKGHYQPRIPADLGYYDLRIPSVREEQASLAREAGIEGFCYWHYWFGNGKQLMAEIVDEVIETGKPDFPFMLGWANHSWYAKNWNTNDSKGKDRLLIEQKYPGDRDLRLHYEYARHAFKDKRYIKEGNRPLFMVYSAKDIPSNMIELWNTWAKEDGFGGVYFIGNIPSKEEAKEYIESGFSAVIKNRIDSSREYIYKNKIAFWYRKVLSHLLNFPDRKIDYSKAMRFLFNETEDSSEVIIPSLVPNFDHSPRSGKYGLILHGSTPELFYRHCRQVLEVVRKKENKFVFLRSWNEWGEGNYMEPDMRYGKKYIQALRKALYETV